ncbi:uncharacterized protein LOC127812293 [Diospyros lotus]|uniref:uncharacterized protein LOC127812293 n=1 Tax=Diospyros lotus TaxID=55363 RepID=UPI002255A4DF|nr:uncharacterized protein LOC127812293 [Diospyros lotus]
MASDLEMGEISINSSTSHQGIMCEHGVPIRSYTSWTKSNPGRRFLRCRFWKDDDCKWFQWIDDERTSREKALCGVLLDILDRNKIEKEANERLLQEQVRAFEEKALRRKQKILKLKKDYRYIMEENLQLKLKFQLKMKFVRVLIVLGLSYFLWIVLVTENNSSRFRYLALL